MAGLRLEAEKVRKDVAREKIVVLKRGLRFRVIVGMLINVSQMYWAIVYRILDEEAWPKKTRADVSGAKFWEECRFD